MSLARAHMMNGYASGLSHTDPMQNGITSTMACCLERIMLGRDFSMHQVLGSPTTSILIPLQVPITLYFMTHAYFCFYHALSNVCIRRCKHAEAHLGPIAANSITALVVFVLAYATAYGETLTIAHFPYYTFKVIPLC